MNAFLVGTSLFGKVKEALSGLSEKLVSALADSITTLEAGKFISASIYFMQQYHLNPNIYVFF